MGYCRVCNNVIMPHPGGARCRNPRCRTNMFSGGSIVRSARHPASGLGKVLELMSGGTKASVLFEDGSAESENCSDLHHAELAPGRAVCTAEGRGTVISSQVGRDSGDYVYSVKMGDGIISTDEQGITDLPPTAPADIFRSGHFDAPAKFILRNRALFFETVRSGDGMLCVHNSRVELMRHQVLIAHRAVQDCSPRYLLADEVGLGKTMEAGLIIKELKARKLAKRVLIIAPSSLVPQWVSEMKSKFNETFEVFDSARVRSERAESPGENPWSSADSVIMSLQFARRDDVADEIAGEHWDMVIFDEAHHLRRRLDGGEVMTTKAYRLAEALRDRCGSLLLLTATPLQLHPYEFYSLLELIDPGRFGDFWIFEVYRQKALPRLNRIISMLEEMKEPGQEFLTEMTDFIGTMEWLRKNVRMPAIPDRPYLDGWEMKSSDPKWRLALLREAREYQVVARYMMRNRKAEVFPGGPRRKPVTVQLQLSEEEKIAYELVNAYVRAGYSRALEDRNTALGFVMVIFQKLLTSSKAALISAFRNRMAGLGHAASAEDEELEDYDMLEESQQEELLERLCAVGSTEEEISALGELIRMLESIDRDTKGEALVRSIDAILGTNPHEKILIFTQFHATQKFLRDILSDKYGAVVFNGKMSPSEKESAIAEFRESAQIMISTEAGGEGRNFQFCHIMFNYDLPWNPMKLEQRIGRLDRIGQDKLVYIYNFSYGNTVEQRILDVLYERIGMFEETVGAMEPILGDTERELAALVMTDIKNLDTAIERYGRSLKARVAEARDIEKRLRDFTMDRRLLRTEHIDALLKRKPLISSDMLKRFAIELVTHLGGTVTGAYEDIASFRLPPGLAGGTFGTQQVRGTFSLDVARKNEDLEFLAFGHPFIDGCISAAVGDRFRPSVALLRLGDGPGLRGVLFVYLVEINDLRRTRKLVPVFIGEDMAFSAKESNDMFEKMIFSRSLAEADRSLASGIDFDAYSAAADAVIADITRTLVKNLRPENLGRVAREKARLERLYSFRAKKLTDQIARDTHILEDFRTSADEKKRRLVPAYTARVENARAELAGLEGERDYALRELDAGGEVTARWRGVGAGCGV